MYTVRVCIKKMVYKNGMLFHRENEDDFEVEAAHSFGNKRRKDMQKYP